MVNDEEVGKRYERGCPVGVAMTSEPASRPLKMPCIKSVQY